MKKIAIFFMSAIFSRRELIATKIEIGTIPHNKQRYETAGDWEIFPDGDLRISVSGTGNEGYALLVAIHEAIEVWLCRKRGISGETVTAFKLTRYQRCG